MRRNGKRDVARYDQQTNSINIQGCVKRCASLPNRPRGYGSYTMDIATVINDYLHHEHYFRNLSGASMRSKRQIVRRLIARSGATRIQDVNETFVEQFFMHGVHDCKWTSATFATMRATLSPFFKWCIARGYITHNPIDIIPRPKLDVRIPKKLTKEQAMQVLQAAFDVPYRYRRTIMRYRNRAIVGVCLFAGLRRTEMLTLKLADVDLRNGEILVRNCKGRRDRIVPINTALRVILKEYIELRTRMNIATPALFCGSLGKGGLQWASFARHMKLLRAWSGVRFSLHALRHTFATMMLEGGCDLFTVSKLLGHNQIQTTTIYLSASPGFLRQEIQKHPMNCL